MKRLWNEPRILLWVIHNLITRPYCKTDNLYFVNRSDDFRLSEYQVRATKYDTRDDGWFEMWAEVAGNLNGGTNRFLN